MEPNKVDKKFKTALKNREIAPTPAAWDRLDAMLTVAEEKKAAPTYNWLYIAATIIGFIAIAVVFLSKTQPLVDVQRDDIVYETPVPTKDSIKYEKPINLLAPKSYEIVVETSNNKPNQQIKSNQKNQKTNPIEEKQINQNPIVNQQTIINQKTEQPDQRSIPNPITENQQIATIESNPKLGKTPIKVNVSNLLSEVDGELELSFREKVINRIDKNYKTVKLALANRNQQTEINQ